MWCMHGNVYQRQYYYYKISVPHLYTDVTDDDGDTPLDYAVRFGHTEVSEYLMSVRKPSTPEPGMCVLY